MSIAIVKLNQIIEELQADSKNSLGADRSLFNRASDRVIALSKLALPENDSNIEAIKKVQLQANATFGFATSKTLELIGIAQIILDEIEIKNHQESHSQPHRIAQNIASGKNEKEAQREVNNKIFIVHGHNEAIKISTARTLEKLGLTPIILHEQANSGDTIIEKFTRNSNVGFAIVLLSADDYGYSKIEEPTQKKLRARQNVILELGFFYGKLGRSRVVALFEQTENFEKPSDIDGVVYIPFNNENDTWRFNLAKELKQAGYIVDANKLIS